MPTYSNLGFKLIDTGTEQGIWGVSTNTNFQYLDSAIVGAVTITLQSAGSAADPYLLTVADYAESNGRNKIVEFISTVDLGTTVYVRITPNDFNGHYFVRNSLLNNRPIVLFQGTYNGITSYELPNGKDAIIRCAGGGVNSTVYNVLDNLYTNAITTNALTTPSFTTTNISASTITANQSFVGPGTGLSGTANQLSANFANTTSTASSTSNMGIALDNNTVSTVYPTIVSGTEGTLPFKVSSSKLSFVPSTGMLTATSLASTTFNVTTVTSGTLSVVTNFSCSADIPEFTGTGAIDIPAGSEAQRPGTATVGMIRYNTSAATYEVRASDNTWKSLTAGSLSQSLGVGQSWGNPPSARALGGTYPGDATKAIAVSVSFYSVPPYSINPPPTVNVTVGGQQIMSVYAYAVTSGATQTRWEQVNFVVPPGQSYSVSSPTGRITVNLWLELR